MANLKQTAAALRRAAIRARQEPRIGKLDPYDVTPAGPGDMPPLAPQLREPAVPWVVQDYGGALTGNRLAPIDDRWPGLAEAAPYLKLGGLFGAGLGAAGLYQGWWDSPEERERRRQDEANARAAKQILGIWYGR